MFNFILKLFGAYYKYCDKQLMADYKKAGLTIGSMIYDRYIGQACGYSAALSKLIKLEKLITSRGYQAVPIALFSMMGNAEDLNVPTREPNEQPILFASIWQQTLSEEDIFCDIFEEVRETDDRIILTAKGKDIFDHERKLLNSDLTSYAVA